MGTMCVGVKTTTRLNKLNDIGGSLLGKSPAFKGALQCRALFQKDRTIYQVHGFCIN